MSGAAPECRHCHRPLTDPVSIAAGYGPVCRSRRGLASSARRRGTPSRAGRRAAPGREQLALEDWWSADDDPDELPAADGREHIYRRGIRRPVETVPDIATYREDATAVNSRCPACRSPRNPRHYLCGTCWGALPDAARRALGRRDRRAFARLRELHKQLEAGVPAAEIQVTP